MLALLLINAQVSATAQGLVAVAELCGSWPHSPGPSRAAHGGGIAQSAAALPVHVYQQRPPSRPPPGGRRRAAQANLEGSVPQVAAHDTSS